MVSLHLGIFKTPSICVSWWVWVCESALYEMTLNSHDVELLEGHYPHAQHPLCETSLTKEFPQ